MGVREKPYKEVMSALESELLEMVKPNQTLMRSLPQEGRQGDVMTLR